MSGVTRSEPGLHDAKAAASRDGDLDPTIRVEAQLGILISRVRSQLRERAAFVHPDLQPAGYLILAALVRRGPSLGRDLVDELGMDKSSVSRQVTMLESLRLVERTADPADGRAYFLVASTTAHEAIARIRTHHQLALYERLRGWPAGDAEKLADLLTQLNEIQPQSAQRAR